MRQNNSICSSATIYISILKLSNGQADRVTWHGKVLVSVWRLFFEGFTSCTILLKIIFLSVLLIDLIQLMKNRNLFSITLKVTWNSYAMTINLINVLLYVYTCTTGIKDKNIQNNNCKYSTFQMNK